MMTSSPTFSQEGTLFAPSASSFRRWTGRALSALAALFLAWDAAMKLVRHPMSIEASARLGYAAPTVFAIGVIAAVCWVLYVVPRTALIGAVLWTGYLGGAVASHLRIGDPLVSHTLFPIYVGAMIWGGLALRDPRVLTLVGSRSRKARER